MNDDKPTPRDLDAERAVLGSMLRWNACIADVVLLVSEDDFLGAANREIFAAVVGLYSDGKPADVVSVSDALKRGGKVGSDADVSYTYLGQLWDEQSHGANAEYYARIVRGWSLQRRLLVAAGEIMRSVNEQNGSTDELLEAAEREIFAVSELGLQGSCVTLREALAETADVIDARLAGKSAGMDVPTGFFDLDRLTHGLHNGELVLIGARPATGKTTLGLCLARNAALKGIPSLFVSLEQSRRELCERLLCAHGDIDGHRLRAGRMHDSEVRQLVNAKDSLDRLEAQIHIDDFPTQSVLRIGANARRLKRRHGIRMVILDYLQMVEPESRKVNREQQIAALTRRLKLMARELSLPVVVLTQLNRGPDEGGKSRKPRLVDFRESGSQEMDADVAILLWRPKEDEDVVELVIAKQRNGPTGEVPLFFRRNYFRMENYATERNGA